MLINIPDETIGRRIIKEVKGAYEVFEWEAACHNEAIFCLETLKEDGEITSEEAMEVEESLRGNIWKNIHGEDIYEQIANLVDEKIEEIRKK